MKTATLHYGCWPTDNQSLEHAFLTVTNYINWRWQQIQQSYPVSAVLPVHPQPGNNIAGCTGNETNSATDPNAIDDNCLV
jgi:hypothetical protein